MTKRMHKDVSAKTEPTPRTSKTQPEQTPLSAAPSVENILMLQRLIGNQAVGRMIQREPDAVAGWSFNPLNTPPNLVPSPQGMQEVIDAGYRPVRDWLETNVSTNAPHSMGDIVRSAWHGCSEAKKISNEELKMLVEEWGRKHTFTFQPVSLIHGPGIETKLTLKLPGIKYPKHDKPDNSPKVKLKTELEVPIAPRVTFAASVGGSDVAVSGSLDIMPMPVELKLGRVKLELDASLVAELESKVEEAENKRKTEAALRAEAGLEAKIETITVGEYPLYLKVELKGSVPLIPGGTPSLEVTPGLTLKF